MLRELFKKENWAITVRVDKFVHGVLGDEGWGSDNKRDEDDGGS